ncbi:MAG: hypothetical protein IKT00_08315 [Prevotella sp.]|nr:hypothetical protein [Prevotella sp.]
MKKYVLTLSLLLMCVSAFAGSVKVTKGKTSGFKENANASISFQWDGAKWDRGEPLQQHWGNDYERLKQVGESSFIQGFNEKSKKLMIEEAEGQYRMVVKIVSLDSFFSVMSFVPGHKHKVDAIITIYEVSTDSLICEIKTDEFEGGRDFSYDDSYAECMGDLGKKISKMIK